MERIKEQQGLDQDALDIDQQHKLKTLAIREVYKDQSFTDMSTEQHKKDQSSLDINKNTIVLETN
jgi:hypothetical protein